MDVGDRMMVGDRVVIVVAVQPDSNGEIPVRVRDRDSSGWMYSTVAISTLTPLVTITEPVTVEVNGAAVVIQPPREGEPYSRAYWQ